MKLLLWVFCWPLALGALFPYPVVWLVTQPFRLLGVAFDGVFELLRAVSMLPARLLGGVASDVRHDRGARCGA